jgi:transcriptional regulator with XRE-family HTH domain
VTTFEGELGAAGLRRLRESRGWSWADLARALRDTARDLGMVSPASLPVSSIQRTVARWESATDRTKPGDRYQYLLARIYSKTLTGTSALGPDSDFAKLLDALRDFGTSPQRIDRLVDSVTHANVSSQPTSTQPTEELVDHLAVTVADLNQQVGSTPFVRLQLLLAPVLQTCRKLLNQPLPTTELLMLATDAYALAARLAFETRDDEAAMTLYRDAESTAARLLDRSRLAAVRTSHTMVTLHATDDLNAALQLARAATVDAHRGSSHAIRARAHAVHAEVQARAGNSTNAAIALDRARKTIEQLSVGDPFAAFNADRVSGFEGLCALYSGQAHRATYSPARCPASPAHATRFSGASALPISPWPVSASVTPKPASPSFMKRWTSPPRRAAECRPSASVVLADTYDRGARNPS